MTKLIAVSILIAGAPALAQPFSMESSTFDSGGVVGAAAGVYVLSGTAGQPDAGVLISGSYECQGGFWNTDSGTGTQCYANCDQSTGTPVLTANDFQCFLNRYAQADPYANCDGSTGTPSLTANDFQCFLNSYATGCS
jgi:hypothetical protein